MPTEKEQFALDHPLEVFNRHLPEIVADSQKQKRYEDEPKSVGECLADLAAMYDEVFEAGRKAERELAKVEVRAIVPWGRSTDCAIGADDILDLLEDFLTDEEEEVSHADVGGEG